MLGKSGTDADAFVPRSTRCLFDTLEGLAADGWEFKVEVSFAEIYNEDVYDLLVGKEDKKVVGPLKITRLSVSFENNHFSFLIKSNDQINIFIFLR